MWVRILLGRQTGEITNQAIGDAWKAFGPLIWMGIETSFLRKMGKVNLYIHVNFAELRFKSQRDCRKFVNRGGMTNIFHRDELKLSWRRPLSKDESEFSWGKPPSKYVGVLITKYKKIGSSKIEIEYRFLDQREFNLEKLLN